MAKAKAKKNGRPTVFTQKIADLICERIMNGESLRHICADEMLPARSTIHKWLAEDKGFSDQYVRARDLQAEHMFDEMLDIADDGTNDWMIRKQGEDEIEVANHEHIQRSKLRIDTRKWQLSKMLPKRYGDKTALVGGDPEIDDPIQVDDRVLARKLAFIIAGASGAE